MSDEKKDRSVIASGIDEAKAELAQWNWDLDSLKPIAAHAGSIMLDEMARSCTAVVDLKAFRMTVWPLGLDTPRLEVDLANVIETELGIEEMYGPNTLRTFADRMRAFAKSADELAIKITGVVADDEE